MCLKCSPAPITDFAFSGIPLVISLYHFVGLEGHQPKYTELCQLHWVAMWQDCYWSWCVFLQRPAGAQKSPRAVWQLKVFVWQGRLFCIAMWMIHNVSCASEHFHYYHKSFWGGQKLSQGQWHQNCLFANAKHFCYTAILLLSDLLQHLSYLPWISSPCD